MIGDHTNLTAFLLQGTLLENFLTKSSKEFKSFLRAGSAPIDKDEKPLVREAFRFAKV